MADFEQTARLSIEVPSRELASAREQIEGALTDVPVSTSGGSAEQAVSGGQQPRDPSTGQFMQKAGAEQRLVDVNRTMERVFEVSRVASETLTDIHKLLVNVEDQIQGGGGMAAAGGGGGGAVGSVTARLGGGLQSVLGGVGLASIIRKAPLRSLLTKAPAFATLVTASDLGAELVTGKLSTQDLVQAPIKLGKQVTFGALDNTAVEAAIGTVTLAIGTYQIGSIVAGTLGSSALSSYFGTVGISSLVSGTLGGSSLAGLLGSVGIGTVLGGLAAGGLAAYLGTVGINQLIEGEINLGARVSGDNPFVQPDSPQFSAPSGTATPGLTTPGELMETVNQGTGQQGLSDAQKQEIAMEVNNQTDVTVNQEVDKQAIIDEVMREVEGENEQLRREIERAVDTRL